MVRNQSIHLVGTTTYADRSLVHYQDGYNELIDLDADAGRAVTGKAGNTFRLVVRPTRKVDLSVLNLWLQGKTSMQDGVLEALSEYSR